MLKGPILDNLWQAGFCKTLIERSRHTQPGSAGAATRMELLQHHIVEEHCRDCLYANILKGVEAATAKWLGPQAETIWMRGGDIRAVPGFDEGFRIIMAKAVATGQVDSDILLWITKTVAERAGKSYPYEDDDGSQAN
jgi:hypothetical protein